MSILPDPKHWAPVTEMQKVENDIAMAEMDLGRIRADIAAIQGRIAKRRKGLPTPNDKWDLEDRRRDESRYVDYIKRLRDHLSQLTPTYEDRIAGRPSPPRPSSVG